MIDENKLIEDLKESGMISDNEFGNKIVDIINSQSKHDQWIYCGDGKNMPEERDSMFAKFKGTDKWRDAMFEKTSDDVNTTVEFEDGSRMTKTLHTVDGKWLKGNFAKYKVIAWQPLPETYKENLKQRESNKAAGQSPGKNPYIYCDYNI